MKVFTYQLLICVFLSTLPAFAAEKSIPFEALVSRSDSELVWNTETGRLDVGNTSLVTTALVVESTCCNDSIVQRHGVRLELAENEHAHTLFVETNGIDELLYGLEILDEQFNSIYTPRVREGRKSACHGLGMFNHEKPPLLHQVNVANCDVAGQGYGLSIYGVPYEYHRYDFPGVRPGEFAQILYDSMSLLEIYVRSREVDR